MQTTITANSAEMGRVAAEQAAEDLRNAIALRGRANIIVATGASQFDVLSQLVEQPEIDWSRVHGFHLDEYIGLTMEHPASFCRYLKERFVDQVPLAAFHFLHGDADPKETISRVGGLLKESPADVAMVGIGENGHLAFNDPPADFETEEPYIIVELDEPCRLQQVGEGWFAGLDDVPTHAISMTVKQIMKSGKIYCSVPDERKADAVRRTLEDEISPQIPASILRNHAGATLIVDEAAASQMGDSTRSACNTATT